MMSRTRGIWVAVCLSLTTLAGAMTTQDAENFRVTKLLGDLNDNAVVSAKARKELVELKDQAVPGLVKEIKAYYSNTTPAILSAARCLRVLSEMKSPSARDQAIEILALVEPGKKKDEIACLLLTEALVYLLSTCGDKPAIEAVLLFIKKSPEKWRTNRIKYHTITVGHGYRGTNYNEKDYDYYVWRGQLGSGPPHTKAKIYTTGRIAKRAWREKQGDGLMVDVFTPLALLVKKEDIDIVPLLVEFLKTMPYRLSLNLPYLSDDGFTPWFLLYVPEGAGDDSQSNWLEPKSRIRILLMRWIGELKVRSAIPDIKPFLRSEHKDERDFSLIVLEKLSKSVKR